METIKNSNISISDLRTFYNAAENFVSQLLEHQNIVLINVSVPFLSDICHFKTIAQNILENREYTISDIDTFNKCYELLKKLTLIESNEYLTDSTLSINDFIRNRVNFNGNKVTIWGEYEVYSIELIID